MSLKGQLVWVLGAGFLGRVLATRCREAGARVLSIDVAPEAGADICADAAAPGVLAGLSVRILSPRGLPCCPPVHAG